jgi:serine/threonine protein kinase
VEVLDAKGVFSLALINNLMTEVQIGEVKERLGENPDLETLYRYLERERILTAWQLERLRKGEIDGFQLGGYTILYKISSGSFGRVYRAVDPRTGRIVAIKVLRRRHAMSEDKQKIDLFMREGQVGLKLRHPNIVEVLGVNQDSVTGQYYIVMEFVEGDNLRELIKIRGKFTPTEGLRLMEDMVLGLQFANSKGYTHRDIKLTNILVSASGAAKLVDFGLAKYFDSSTGKDDGDKVDRTVDYAGLERATGAKAGDVRSDIFFLGVVFYEMLTGKSPIEMSRDRRARMLKQRFDNVQPLSRLDVEAPASTIGLINKMMSLNPDSRFQNPNQLLDAIRNARKDIETGESGNASGAASKVPSVLTIFIVESDMRLQDALRQKFRELGYKVLIAADPQRAQDRFRSQPFECLVVDGGSTGMEGIRGFEMVLRDANLTHSHFAGVLILNEEQAPMHKEIALTAHGAVLIRPVTLKQVHAKIQELLAGPTEAK